LVPAEFFDCSFLANYEPPDLIFGLGEVIPEYFCLLKLVTTTIAGKMARRKDADVIFDALTKDFDAFERTFNGYLEMYERNEYGMQSFDFRSNYFINLYGLRTTIARGPADTVTITPNFVSTKSDYTVPQREFTDKFMTSPWGLSTSSVPELARGIRKDSSSPAPGESEYEFVRNNLGGVRQYMVRRSCKYLLYDVVNRGGSVHYALDDVGLDKLAGDDGVPSPVLLPRKNVHKRPVCTSEIRELFRMWNYFGKDFRVIFYKELEYTNAPWDITQYRRGWAAYARHLATKAIAKLGPAIGADIQGKLTAVVNERADDAAIKKYHEINYVQLVAKGNGVIVG
jgi:hypothetical protein